jgi:hypothetical protein
MKGLLRICVQTYVFIFSSAEDVPRLPLALLVKKQKMPETLLSAPAWSKFLLRNFYT